MPITLSTAGYVISFWIAIYARWFKQRWWQIDNIKRCRIHIIIICTICYKFSSKLRFPLLSIIIIHGVHIVYYPSFYVFIRYMHVCQNLLIIEESIYVLLLSMALLSSMTCDWLHLWIIELWTVYGPLKNVIYRGIDGLQLFTCSKFFFAISAEAS